MIHICAFVLLLCSSPAFALGAGLQAVPGPQRVTGIVVDAHTKAAIAGAHVRLSAASTPAPDQASGREAVTDAGGAFAFDDVPPGTYRLIVALDGFQSFIDARELAVTGDAEPPPIVIGYALRITAEAAVQANGLPAADTAAGSEMNAIAGQSVVVAPGALEDVMRTFQARPGVAASQDDRNDMLVRGGGAIENATRIDGFDVPNPSHFGTPGSSGGAFSIIPPWLIDRAVLRAGGFSVEFGERASSVLDLTLRSAATDRLRGQVGASVGGAMGEAEGTFGGGHGSWLVSARRSFLPIEFTRDTDRAVPHYGDLVGRIDYAPSSAHRIELLAIRSMDDVIVTSGPTSQASDSQGVTMFGASLRSQWSASTATALFASYARTGIDAEVGGYATTDGSDRSTEVELRLRAELRRRLGRDAELLFGVAMKRPDILFDLDANGFRNLFGVWVKPLRAHFPYSFTDAGAYGEVRLPSLGHLRVTPGVRLDRMGTTDRFYASPRMTAEYAIGRGVRLTGAYGMYRQTLPYVWIGSDPRNASLDPIQSRQALAGISVRLPARLDLLVEAFDKRYDGYPVDASNQWWHVLVDAAADYESPFVGQLAPAGRLFAHGVDTSVGRRFANGVELNASYSYWRVSQQSSYQPTGYIGPMTWQQWLRADYDIRHQVRVNFAWESPGRWRFASQFRYASGRPYTPYDVVASIRARTGRMDVSSFDSATYPAYHRLDTRIDRTFAIRSTRLVLYAELDNVYNRDNLYLYEWNHTTGQARPVYQWGRLPVGGVRWEF